jgi:hypothetical protein
LPVQELAAQEPISWISVLAENCSDKS